RDAVLRRKCDQREPPDHVAPRDVVVLPVLGGGPLRGQDAIEVTVERRRAALGASVPFRACANDQVAQRAGRLAGLRRPVEAVALAGSAGELLRVLEDAVALVILRVVLALPV